MLRKILLGFVALIVVLAIAGIGGLWWIWPSSCGGTVSVSGPSRPVEIVCDGNGVPHIFAEDPNDAYFALGYMHARDRLWQMEFMRRLGAGRLAEVLGEPALKTDRFIRTLGLYRLAEANADALPPDVRNAFDAYATGVNAWLEVRSDALPPEFILLQFEPEPWQVADSLVWGRLMALRLGRNWRAELVRARLTNALSAKKLPAELLDQLWPKDPSDAPVTLRHASRQASLLFDRVWRSVPDDLSDGASNAWVVDGRRTDTGKPILTNDPHLSFNAPGLWYLARIEAPGLTVTGATVAGVPLTLLGHNGRIAWGFTNARGDVQDLFVETVDPNDPNSYLTPNGSKPFLLIRDTPSEEVYVLNMFRMRGSRI